MDVRYRPNRIILCVYFIILLYVPHYIIFHLKQLFRACFYFVVYFTHLGINQIIQEKVNIYSLSLDSLDQWERIRSGLHEAPGLVIISLAS